ncbi:hypothetical protein MMC14_004188 [Varicellaria rhodocarpa]|nr:hypothetical protein [Varicellaria rhodocarpa]
MAKPVRPVDFALINQQIAEGNLEFSDLVEQRARQNASRIYSMLARASRSPNLSIADPMSKAFFLQAHQSRAPDNSRDEEDL